MLHETSNNNNEYKILPKILKENKNKSKFFSQGTYIVPSAVKRLNSFQIVILQGKIISVIFKNKS
jgi:hypothetical protein